MNRGALAAWLRAKLQGESSATRGVRLNTREHGAHARLAHQPEGR
jgi:hypothetical protein